MFRTLRDGIAFVAGALFGWKAAKLDRSALDPDEDITAQTLDAGEENVYSVYRESVKGALESANKAAEAVTTASLSIATAYGALVALVTPESRPLPFSIGIPIIFFALAAVVALWARSQIIEVTTQTELDPIIHMTTSHIQWKRILVRAAVGVLFVALGASAWLLDSAYEPPAESQTTPTTIVIQFDLDRLP